MSLTSDDYRTIDQLRQKLLQLSSSIQSVKVDLERNEPLPKPEALASSAHILNYSLTQFNQIFAQHRQFLNAAHAYPLPNFPGTTQEVLLGQLVKKKLEPRAQDWVDEYSQAKVGEDEKKPFREQQMRELWDWAGPASSDVVRELITNDSFEDDYTFAEREAGIENVVTGLKRKLGDDDSDDEDDDEDEGGDKMDEDVRPDAEEKSAAEPGIDTKLPPMLLDKILAFTTTGALPPGFT